jgi:hypothetical protein
MPNFMVLMRENDRAWSRLSPEEQQRLLEKYYAWADRLRANGQFKGGAALSEKGAILQVVNGEIVDGPFTETKEVVTGFFLIEAPDLAAATEIAKGCPALDHGETVIVRQTGHDG